MRMFIWTEKKYFGREKTIDEKASKLRDSAQNVQKLVWIPQFSIIKKSCKKASKDWNPEKVRKYQKSFFSAQLQLSQFHCPFEQKEIRTGLSLFFQSIVPKRWTVVAGFNGRFASALKDAKLEVLFTDFNSRWVRKAQTNGFKTECQPSCFISKKEVDGWITYEGNEAFSGTIGLLAIMKCLSETSFGLVYVRSFKGNDPRPPLEEFKLISKVYSAKIRHIKTKYLSWYSLTASKKSKELLTDDLITITKVNRKIRQKNSAQTNRRLNCLFMQRPMCQLKRIV